MATLYYPPTINGLQKTLGAQLDQGETSAMTLNNVTGVQNKPGVVLINRIDTNGAELDSSLREFVIYTGTSGSTLTGLTRAIGGSSDRDHAIGSVVEFVPDITVFQALVSALDGTDLGGISPKLVVTDTINESTSTAGVTIDSLLVKDAVARHAAKAIQTTAKAGVYLAGNQNITATEVTKIAFETEVYDPGSGYSTVESEYAAPTAGTYLVTTNVRLTAGGDNESISLHLYKNDAEVVRYNHSANSTIVVSLGFSYQIPLAANDIIDIRVANLTANDTINSGATLTWMQVHLLSVD